MPDEDLTPAEQPDKKTEVKIEGNASILALVVAALVTAVFAFLLGLARRRANIERNKALVLEEELEQVKEQAKLEHEHGVRETAAKRVLELQAKVDSSLERIDDLDEQHAAYVKKLKGVNSWDELFKD